MAPAGIFPQWSQVVPVRIVSRRVRVRNEFKSKCTLLSLRAAWIARHFAPPPKTRVELILMHARQHQIMHIQVPIAAPYLAPVQRDWSMSKGRREERGRSERQLQMRGSPRPTVRSLPLLWPSVLPTVRFGRTYLVLIATELMIEE